ncbi:hypothetical protein SeLEV6574_g03531 [Synchytrium endobioticum]|uniref:Citrate transporter-like domain-containing protein n=1 Tax=Synchytrium endobioticum TaxID=286115 RepID=A0A507D3E3_9FUNG|nr:hypothetical protein SeLEV6574_g03531 [Synchytrium endobioticum]
MAEELLSIRSYASLASFLVTIFVCVRPLIINLPPFLCRFSGCTHVKVDLGSAPVLCILFQLATTVVGLDVVRAGFLGSAGIQPYGIIVLFFSLAYVSISIDLTGLFSYIAFQVTKRGGGDGMKMYNSLFILSVVLTVFTSNDVVVLTVTPILCYLGKASKIDVSAFTLSSFIVCNVASMMLYIGNPTNVVVAQASSINFLSFTAWMGLPTIVGILCAYVATRCVVSGLIPPKINPPPPDAELQYALKDRAGAVFGVTILLSCLVCLMVVPLFRDVGVWLLTAPFCLCLLVKDVITDLYRTPLETVVLGQHADEDVPLGNLQISERPRASIACSDLEVPNGVSVDRETHPIKELHGAGHWNDAQIAETATGGRRSDSVDHLCAEVDLGTSSTHVLPGSLPSISRTATAASTHPNHDHGKQPPNPPTRSVLVRLPVTSTALSRCPWKIAPFALGMFILVESLNSLSWTSVLSSALAHTCTTVPSAVFSIGFISAVSCSLLNNLPMTILGVRIIQHPNFLGGVGGDEVFKERVHEAALWGLVVGSNIGADLTFVASLAGLMWSELLKMKGMEMNQWRFAKLCVGVMILSLVGSLGTLVLEFVVMGRL